MDERTNLSKPVKLTGEVQDDAVQSAVSALLPAFLANRLGELETLQRLAEEQDWERLSEHAHRLSGVGLLYGFAEISRFGIELTQLTERHDRAAALARIQTYALWLRDTIPRG